MIPTKGKKDCQPCLCGDQPKILTFNYVRGGCSKEICCIGCKLLTHAPTIEEATRKWNQMIRDKEVMR